MRPPITATNTKNDGAAGIQTTLHRKQQKLNQKDIIVENQNFQSNTFKPNYSQQQLLELEQQQKIIKNPANQTNDISLSSSFSIINENSNNHHTNFAKTNNDIKLINKNLVTTSSIDLPVVTTINSNLNSNSNNSCINNKNLIGSKKQFNSDISDLNLTSLSNINEKQFNFDLNDDNIEHEHSNDVRLNENFNKSCDLKKVKQTKNFNTNYIDEKNNLHLINSRKNKLTNNIQFNDATATTTATAKSLDYNLDLNDTNNSICLNKNSASLIFTKKDIPTTTTATKINEKQKLNNTNNSNNKNINCIHHSIPIGANSKILRKNNSNLIVSQIPSSYSSSSTSSSSLSTSTSSLKNTNNDNDLINFDENNITNSYHRNSLQLNYINLNDNQEYNFNNNSNNINLRTTTATANRKQLAYSWYAPIYSALEEEIEQDSKDSTPTHNLANLKKTNSAKLPSQQHHKQQQFYISSTKSLDENEKLLENKPHPNIQPLLHNQPRLRRQQLVINQQEHNNNISKNPSHLQLSPVVQQSNIEYEGPQSASLLAGGPLPRRRRFENFLKSLVGRKASKDSSNSPVPGVQLNNPPPPTLPSPEITVTQSPSENSLLRDFNSRLSINGNPTGESYYDKITNSTLSLNTVQQKLWNVVPLLRRENSALSLHNEKSNSIVQYTGLRKCETVLALSRQSAGSGYIGSVTTVNNNNSNTCSMPVNIKRNSYGISLQPNSTGPIKPQNRLRNSLSTTNATCSRCSSLLSLAASGSKYSLNNGYISINNNSNLNNSNNNNFINANSSKINRPTENISDVRKSLSSSFQYNNNDDNIITSNDCIDGNLSINDVDDDNNSGNISPPLSSTDESTTLTLNSAVTQLQLPEAELFKIFSCKLCLSDVINFNDATTIVQCGCKFCTECIKSYIEFEITEGAYDISCPDAQCPVQGIISLTEISGLVSNQLIQKYHRYRLNREIELDKTRTWCPRAGCETICLIGPTEHNQKVSPFDVATPTAIITNASENATTNSENKFHLSQNENLCNVLCPTCREEFCSSCKKPWHPNLTCEEYTNKLVAEGQDDGIGIPFDNDLIKCCPMCAVPIEKDEGCAQMMCKRCKHVFCWYCLASLDDDFLLRHYDKGPCKNKLGHSRASVVWHRAQVIGIFAGFGILLLVASPLLLLAAPCIICCKCRICNSSTKLDDPDADFDDGVALQR